VSRKITAAHFGGPNECGGHEHSKDDETLNPPKFEKNEHSDAELQSGKQNHEEDNIPTRSLIILLAQELSKNMFQDGWFAQNCTAVAHFCARYMGGCTQNHRKTWPS
jgi:hypothetical protein